MLLSPLIVIIAALPLAVLCGVLPTHNRVIGVAPPDVLVNQEVLGIPAGDVVTQAGSLRYVENSGVCGETHLLNPPPACMLTTGQKRPAACTQLQAMHSLLPRTTCSFGSLRHATTRTLHR